MASNLEFRKGYAFAYSDQIIAVLQGFKQGAIGKDELRVFAARLELGAQPVGSKVTLPTVLQQKGGKGLRAAKRKLAEDRLQAVLVSLQTGPEAFRVKICRQLLRGIAKGETKTGVKFSPGLICLFLFYSLRRKSQKQRMKCLQPGQKYARFSYKQVEQFTGLSKSTCSRLVATLEQLGIIQSVPIKQQNVNRYGRLYVDGPVLSLLAENNPLPKAKTSLSDNPQGRGKQPTGVTVDPLHSRNSNFGQPPCQKQTTPTSTLNNPNKLLSKTIIKNTNPVNSSSNGAEGNSCLRQQKHLGGDYSKAPGNLGSPADLRNISKMRKFFELYHRKYGFSDSAHGFETMLCFAAISLRKGQSPVGYFLLLCKEHGFRKSWAIERISQQDEQTAQRWLKADREANLGPAEDWFEKIVAATALRIAA